MAWPKKTDPLIFFTLFLLVTLVTALSVNESSRLWMKDHFLSHERVLLGKAEGDLTGQGDFVSVVKIKSQRELSIEVYSTNPETQESHLRSRLILPEHHDGFIQLSGQTTNIGLVDLNHDGILEIIAPTYDDNLVPRLRIYRYDPRAQVFLLTGPEFLSSDPKSQQFEIQR